MIKRKTNEEILVELKAELIRLNTVTKRIYDSERRSGQYCSQTTCKYLGMNWREVVSLVFSQSEAEMLLPKEEQLSALKEEFERLGSNKKRIYSQNRNKEKYPNPDLLCKHLEMSWREITRACDQMNNVEGINVAATDEDLIKEYKSLSDKYGRPLTIQELSKNTIYSFDTYKSHFGTISKLKLMCGYEVRKAYKRTITKEECIQELASLYKKRGKVLTFDEIVEHSNISMTTILERFNTTKIKEVWDEVLEIND